MAGQAEVGAVYNWTHEEIFMGFGKGRVETAGEATAQGDIAV